MKVSIHFHTFIRAHGPQVQKCMICGALHEVDEKNNIRLKVPGSPLAKLSQIYDYPEHKPYRVGDYRVRYSNGNWSKTYVTFDGDVWRNGPVLFHAGSIVAWQGLAGDMEHTKRMPYDIAPPIPFTGDEDGTN